MIVEGTLMSLHVAPVEEAETCALRCCIRFKSIVRVNFLEDLARDLRIPSPERVSALGSTSGCRRQPARQVPHVRCPRPRSVSLSQLAWSARSALTARRSTFPVARVGTSSLDNTRILRGTL